MNILIFTDSRGEHKKTFENKEIFTEKIKKNFGKNGLNIDLLLCPFRHTTTIDFMYIMEKYANIADYDLIILYTGIVESSPRPMSNYNRIMDDNKYEEVKFKNLTIKINKKEIFEYFFSSELLGNNCEYSTIYKTEKTKSLVSLEMYEKIIIPYLLKIGNKLILINSNKICKGWEGNYLLVNKAGRPKNINIIEQYADMASKKIPNIINLDWNNDEIKQHTVDNMHLTYLGSEYIYDRIVSKISSANDKVLFVMGNGPSLKEIMDNEYYLKIIKDNDSFGLNAAYRAYDKYNFNPTYFGCFDHVVNKSHKDNFEKLVENSKIKEFYFIGDVEKKQNLYSNVIYNNPKFIKFNYINMAPTQFNKLSLDFSKFYNAGASGANALQVGILKKYKKIILFGCDCNYVEILDESKKVGRRLQIDKEIKSNPNYWFDNYQQIGDVYNVPNVDIYQMTSWKNISKYCPNNVSIVNCSNVSKIPYFAKMSFDMAIDKYKLNPDTKLRIPSTMSVRFKNIVSDSKLKNIMPKNNVKNIPMPKNNVKNIPMPKNNVKNISISKNTILNNTMSKSTVSKGIISNDITLKKLTSVKPLPTKISSAKVSKGIISNDTAPKKSASVKSLPTRTSSTKVSKHIVPVNKIPKISVSTNIMPTNNVKTK